MVLPEFLAEYLFVYLWLFVTTFVNIIAPMPGSVVVNPVIAYFTDPQRAIGIGALIFALTGLHRIYLFRAEAFRNSENRKIIARMLPYSILGAVLGGFLISYLSIQLLVIGIIAGSTYFIGKTLFQMKGPDESKKQGPLYGYSQVVVALVSGFLQGTGLPGSDVRNNYLRTILAEISVRAVTSVIGSVSFLVAGSVIFFQHKLTPTDLLLVLTSVPFLIPIQYLGKRLLETIRDAHAKLIAIAFSSFGIILLAYKYLV